MRDPRILNHWSRHDCLLKAREGATKAQTRLEEGTGFAGETRRGSGDGRRYDIFVVVYYARRSQTCRRR